MYDNKNMKSLTSYRKKIKNTYDKQNMQNQQYNTKSLTPFDSLDP